MGEKDFQQEVIDRLARIETKQDATIATVSEHTRIITDQGKEIVRIDASTRAAHHRISGICATAGAFGAIAGTAAQVIASFWPKGSGHG